MQELYFVEAKKLEWRERPTPRIEGDRQALVRPLAVARCDLDLPIALGRFPLPGPFAIGHEVVGEVIEVGASVKRVRAGDRVSVPFQLSCGECDRCRRGQTASCSAFPPRASYGLAPISGKDFGGA